jgi:hypothetical protein
MRSASATSASEELRRDWPLVVLLVLYLLLPGCATSFVWSAAPDRDRGEIDWTDGRTIAAVAVTPVALAVDVAILAGLACIGVPFSFPIDTADPRDRRLDRLEWRPSDHWPQ